MLNNILKLDGAQSLSKDDQKKINGGCPVGFGLGNCGGGQCIFPNGNCGPCPL